MVLDGGPLLIGEFLAVNDGVLSDADGDYSDWIEVYNPSGTLVSLEGWYLTDDSGDLLKWQFPDTLVPPRGHLVVFASGKDRRDAGGELHTNFQLDAGGEYLGLVRPDGVTVAHEFAPEYPAQIEGFSYGIAEDVATLVPEGAESHYLVPASSDASLGTHWTARDFDDSAWTGGLPPSPLLITEIGTHNPDYLEIQNVSDAPADTSGWVVAINDAGNGNINEVYQTVWDLPDSVAPDEVLYRSDDADDAGRYWGNDIFWKTKGTGWAMVVDNAGEVADFVVWGYSAEEIASLSVSVNGYDVTADDAWTGAAMASGGNSTNSYQRGGNTDRDNAADWARISPASPAAANPGLTRPFRTAPVTGLGFTSHSTGFVVTRYAANVAVDGLSTAEDVIGNPSQQSSSVSEHVGVIDYLDTGNAGHYGRDAPFPGLGIGSGGDDFVIEATTTVVIPEAGPWTFGVNGDDGFSLALSNGSDTLFSFRPTTRPNGDVLSVFDLPRAGTYDLRLVYFDHADEASLELFAAQGAHGAFDPALFALVGDPAGGGLLASGAAGAIQTDVGPAMHDVNTSLWARIPFTVSDVSELGKLRLRVKYRDGFVAYLNGQEIARRNAPDTLGWDSAATAARGLQESFGYEEIDVSASLGALVTGENVLAIHALNVDAADDEFLIVPELIAESGDAAGRYFADPTPGGPNGQGYLGVVADTKFSVDRGFYETAFSVAITTDTPGATVRYTLDGSEPTATHGTVYAEPVTVGTTTTLRAAAFEPDHYASNVDTQTYIFLDDVLRQPNDPAGFPRTWQPGYPADYEMDPQVVNDPLYAGSIKDDLLSLPSVSIVMDVDDVFGQPGGIYSNSVQSGPAWERATSVEWIDPEDPDRGFQLNSAVRAHGKGNRFPNRTRKHNFRLLFKQPYGPTKLEFPLFEGSPVERFDTIVLRAGYNYSWNHNSSTQRIRAQYLRDTFTRETHREMGQLTAHGDYVHLYVNGLYWGVYQTSERPDASFQAQHLGGEKDQYDALNGNKVVDGDRKAYDELMRRARENLAIEANYQAVLELLDPTSLIDYMVLQMYSGTTDWPVSEGQLTNWWMGRKRVDGEEGRFKFYTWDAEHTQYSVSVDRFGVNNFGTPPYLFAQLRANQEFRRMVGDRVHLHMFNGGALTIQENVARYTEWADKIQGALVGESARWADQKPEQANRPHTVLNEWMTERNWMLNTYFPQRHGVVLQQFRSHGLYPSVAAPVFHVNGSYRHGGEISSTDRLTLPSNADVVYYTLDGSDPRLPGGEVSPSAQRFEGQSVFLDESAMVTTRAVQGGAWSALNRAQFLVGAPATAADLVVTELNYNPYPPSAEESAIGPDWDNDDFEFIELRNVSNRPIELRGVEFTDGIEYRFEGTGSTRLPPGESVVVAANAAAFVARYGSEVHVAGEYAGQFKNGGEPIALVSSMGESLLEFEYDDGGAWPERADGGGSSLELVDPAAAPPLEPARAEYFQRGDHWRASSEYGGSPGAEGSGSVAEVTINEVLANTPMPLIDTIELHNRTADAIDVSGWYLSDSGDDYRKFRIPGGTVIAGGGYLVFDERDFNPAPADPASNGFALNGARGDDVWLLQADADGALLRFVDHVRFDASIEGESFGRWPNASGSLYPMSSSTLDPAGPNSGPRVGPLVISELHYQPDQPDRSELEFVEIYNPTEDTVDLTGWRVRGGIDFDFSDAAALAAHAAVVLVPFDVGDAGMLYAFREHHGIDESVVILGGYSGRLSNEGELVRLLRPGTPAEDDPDYVPRLLEDEVRYDVVAPWPTTAAGGGHSLQRRGAGLWGHDSESWIAAPPTPGAADLQTATVIGRHIFYNHSSFDDAIAPDKNALLPGQEASFANYTNYFRGINGIMLDIANLADPANLDAPAQLDAASDFQFRVGNGSQPDSWSAAPAPQSITVRQRAGVDGSDQVTIIWPDNAIQNQWLQVTVRATQSTGLIEDDVFYFGNAIGEAGNSTLNAIVNATDEIVARNFQHGPTDLATIDDPYDYNRDRLVNTTDRAIARSNQTGPVTMLRLITAPAVDVALAEVLEQDTAD